MSQQGMSHSDADQTDHPMSHQYIVGKIVSAPTTGQGAFLRSPSPTSSCPPVPPGQISKNSLRFLKNLQDPLCNDRQWYHISLFLFSFLTLYLRFKLHGNLNLHHLCFPDIPARTRLPCSRKRVDRFHRITHRLVDPSRPSAPPTAPKRSHSSHLQRRRSPLFLSPPFFTSPPRFVSATTRHPTNKPFLPPFQEQAERASLPVVSLAYLPTHSHPHPSSRSCVRRPFVLISPLNPS